MFQSQANSIMLLISLYLSFCHVLARNTCLLCPGPELSLSFMLPAHLPVFLQVLLGTITSVDINIHDFPLCFSEAILLDLYPKGRYFP